MTQIPNNLKGRAGTMFINPAGDSENNHPYYTSNTVLAAMHGEADAIQRLMDIPANLQDPASLTYRLNELDTQMSRLSDMMIQAKAMRDKTGTDYWNENETELTKLTATIQNRKINAFLHEHTVLYNRLDAMYHTMEHLTRDLVTQISYIKKQMEQFGG